MRVAIYFISTKAFGSNRALALWHMLVNTESGSGKSRVRIHIIFQGGQLPSKHTVLAINNHKIVLPVKNRIFQWALLTDLTKHILPGFFFGISVFLLNRYSTSVCRHHGFLGINGGDFTFSNQ